jgi:hypothetical protein
MFASNSARNAEERAREMLAKSAAECSTSILRARLHLLSYRAADHDGTSNCEE